MTVNMVSRLLVCALLTTGAGAIDGCDGNQYRCGDVCIDAYAACTCGGQVIPGFEEGMDLWCCINSTETCSGGGEEGAVCPEGSLLPLTEKCHGRCKPGRNGGRSYAPCTNTTNTIGSSQCVREPNVQDSTLDCVSGTDIDPFNPMQPINPSSLLPCRTSWDGTDQPGLTCSGALEHFPDHKKSPGNIVGCLPMVWWCGPLVSIACDELGGRLSSDAELCSNYTFWKSQPCGELGGKPFDRCTGAISGQCVMKSMWGDEELSCLDYSDRYNPIEEIYKSSFRMGEACTTITGDNGLTCQRAEQGCLSLQDWCSFSNVHKCNNEGGHSMDLSICSNVTLWGAVSCEEGKRRCEGRYMGQCVKEQLWGDGKPDCSDMSDEGHNLSRIIVKNNDNEFVLLRNIHYRQLLDSAKATKEVTREECTGIVCHREGSKGEVCLDERLRCDGSPNCWGGEDEEGCEKSYKEKSLFPAGANFQCGLPHRVIVTTAGPTNFSTHRAVFYDGKSECWGGEDETPPYLPNSLPYIVCKYHLFTTHKPL